MPGPTPTPPGGLPPIPFNRPTLVGSELDYVRRAVEGGHISAAGPFSKQVAALLREAHGAADVIPTTSCTDALEMAAMLLDRRPGDTVIVPSFTFVSTALAFAREGFGLVFADIEPVHLGLDAAHVASLVDEHTRAVVVVHYGGIAADLPGLDRAIGGPPHRPASRTTPTASSPPSAAAPWAPSGAWPRSRSTRRRTSPAARAGR